MIPKLRYPLVAIGGVLALAMGSARASAQTSTQDTSTTQTQRATPAAPQQGGVADTSGYAEFKETMGEAKDTLSTAAGKTTNYRQRKTYKGKSDTTQTETGAARASDMPQQGGPTDTSGYAEFKETMGKAGDTLCLRLYALFPESM